MNFQLTIMKNTMTISKVIKLCCYTFFASALSLSSANAQDGIKLNTADAYVGYTLCDAESLNSTFLLDNCGEIVNRWTNTTPQHYSRLTEEGHLIYISGNSIIERDWNNKQVQFINVNSNGLLLDYEVMKLKNGNFLAASRRIRNSAYFDQLGWSPNVQKPNRTDGVVEIDQNGNIVWEWNIGDHTIQDNVTTASNYGNISDHPELVDINAISDYDWQYPESFMINSIDYNPELDQILISMRKVSEFMIIDHSTTTSEAIGSTGGNSGKGGDILYRWGNPQNYGQGNDSDRILYYQHNPNWVKYGEHKGKVIMYNNGLTRFVPGIGSMSSVHIVNTPIDADGNYLLEDNQAFEPSTADVTIDQQTTGTNFYSGYTSGAQVLPNGNIYITVGLHSDFMEVKTDGTLVWDYALANSSYSYIFRTEKYAPDFPGFEGKYLTANGTVEFPSSSYNCNLFTSTEDIEDIDFFTIQFDHSTQEVEISSLESSTNSLAVRNIQGQLITSYDNVNIGNRISIERFPMGLYYFTMNDFTRNKRLTRKIMKY